MTQKEIKEQLLKIKNYLDDEYSTKSIDFRCGMAIADLNWILKKLEEGEKA